MSAMGSSMTFTRPSKGERRLLSRAGGEQREHGEEAEQRDLVCTRSLGGGRGGGDISGLGDALMLSNLVFLVRTISIGSKGNDSN